MVPAVASSVNPANLPDGVFVNTAGLEALRAESLASQHQRTMRMVNAQTGASTSVLAPEPRKGSAVVNASWRTSSFQPVDDSFCSLNKTKDKKQNVHERFGSVCNWSGAKVDWMQTSSSKHKLGVALRVSGKNWGASGTSTITKETRTA